MRGTLQFNTGRRRGDGTTRTGLRLLRTTSCATDPRKVWATTPRPCDPRLMASTPSRSAAWTIASAGAAPSMTETCVLTPRRSAKGGTKARSRRLEIRDRLRRQSTPLLVLERRIRKWVPMDMAELDHAAVSGQQRVRMGDGRVALRREIGRRQHGRESGNRLQRRDHRGRAARRHVNHGNLSRPPDQPLGDRGCERRARPWRRSAPTIKSW